MPAGPFRNVLLNQMASDVIARLQLRRVEFPARFELEVPGEGIHSVFFVEEGMGSMTTCFINGVQVETSIFGYESAVGVSALMGTKHSLNRIFMQLAGYGYASPIKAAQTEFERGSIFHTLALRYVQAQLTLSTQNAACNAVHTCEQRLARWLLICADRSKQDDLEVAQEAVAEMLGITRSMVSIAAAHLKAKGVIGYHRGTIHLLKKKDLEAEACECYRVVRDHLENLTHFDTGLVV